VNLIKKEQILEPASRQTENPVRSEGTATQEHLFTKSTDWPAWAHRARRFGGTDRHIARPLASEVGGEQWKNLRDMLTAELGDGFIYALSGIGGTGKTQIAIHLLCEMTKRLILDNDGHASQPIYCTAFTLFATRRSGFAAFDEFRGARGRKSELEILRGFITPKLLIIDELEKGKWTEDEKRTFLEIVGGRYAGAVDTLLITNFTAEAVGDLIGPSIVSRMTECGGVIECDWPSFRETVRDAHSAGVP